MKNFHQEIKFQTTRSGGKGGQNVNKVETAVIGSLNIVSSALLTNDEKTLLQTRLSTRINKEGELIIRSQTHRSQLENKEDVVQKTNAIISDALKKKKIRVPTKQSRASKEKRLDSKKRMSEIKSGRQKWKGSGY